MNGILGHLWFIVPIMIAGCAALVGGGLAAYNSRGRAEFASLPQIYLAGQIKESAKSAFVGSSISALAVVFQEKLPGIMIYEMDCLLLL